MRLLLFLVAAAPAPVRAAGGFHAAQLVSAGSGAAAAPAVTTDTVGNVYVVYTEAGAVRYDVGPPFTGGSLPIADNGLNHRHPGVATMASGVATVTYAETDPAPGATGDEIFAASNLGGPFGTPVNLSEDPAADSRPAIAAAGLERAIAWVRDEGALGLRIWLSRELAPAAPVTDGDAPSLAVSAAGALHLVYERGGDIYYRADLGGGFSAEEVVAQAVPPEADPRVALDAAGRPVVAFVRDGDVFLAVRLPGGGFGFAENVSNSADPSAAPCIAAAETGAVHLIYEEAGDLWYVAGFPGQLPPAENITLSPGLVESAPALALDAGSFPHVVYQSAGDVYYRNAVPLPVVAFSATPVAGELPLTASFTNETMGVVTSWAWAFGDGGSSSEQHPVHTYPASGSFDVTLTATGPGGVVSLTRQDYIQVESPSNRLAIPPIPVFQAEPDVVIPVLATHPEPLQGYQIAFAWSSEHLDVFDMQIENTAVEVLAPEFVALNIEPESLTFGVVIDFIEPLDGRTLEPGTGQRIANIALDVEFGAPLGPTILDLRNDLGAPPILNVFTVGGHSILPVLEDGVLTVGPFVFPGPTLFLRGDADSGGFVNLADAIYVLSFLFSGGPGFLCADSADANDSGGVDISDAVYLLDFLFLSGPVPPYPFPAAGFDPTPDPLGEC